MDLQEKLIQHKLWLDSDGKEGEQLTNELIKEELEKHKLWLETEGKDGEQFNTENANLSYANLSGANLNGANLGKTDLTKADLSRASFWRTDLFRANLSKADLSGVILGRASLKEAKLVNSNLMSANLIEVNAVGTDFVGAILTNACIQDWHINSNTKFDHVECQAIYFKAKYDWGARFEFFDRRPSNKNEFFNPGDFEVLVRQSLETVDLIFREGIDWNALSISMDNFKEQNNGVAITVQSIEHKLDDFVVKFAMPPNSDVDKGAIETTLKQGYEEARLLLEAQYKKELNAKDNEIAIYREQNTHLNEIVKIMASRPISINNNNNQNMDNTNISGDQNLNAKNSVVSMGGISGNVNNNVVEHNDMSESKYNLSGANIGNFAETNKGNQIANQYNYAPEQKQTLAEAAAEIQQLLNQLSQTYPTNSPSERAFVAGKAYEEIEKNPNQKEKIVKALKVGGIAALKQMVKPVSEPITNVLFPMLEELNK
jgi:hypothetical protein